jgi:hypothetical protein
MAELDNPNILLDENDYPPIAPLRPGAPLGAMAAPGSLGATPGNEYPPAVSPPRGTPRLGAMPMPWASPTLGTPGAQAAPGTFLTLRSPRRATLAAEDNPPVMPAAAPAAAPPTLGGPTLGGPSSAVPNTASGYTPVRPKQTIAYPDRNAAEFQAPPISLGKRILGSLAVGAGAYKSPQLGQQIQNEVFDAPKEAAAQKYQTAVGDYMRQTAEEDRAQKEDLAEREAQSRSDLAKREGQSREDLQGAQGREADARAQALLHPPQEKPKTNFELWHEQNPNAPATDYLKAEQDAKPQRLTDPFEAFAYGTPEQKQAAKDFLDAEKKAGARYEKPGEIEQRYDLFRKDPDSYREMFGDKGAAQDAAQASRDQAQASRMLKYFDGQRKRIEQDWTLDEPTRAQQLAEIDRLGQPYLDATAPGPGKGGAAQFKSGQTVYDKQGNPRKIKNVLKDGRLELE